MYSVRKAPEQKESQVVLFEDQALFELFSQGNDESSFLSYFKGRGLLTDDSSTEFFGDNQSVKRYVSLLALNFNLTRIRQALDAIDCYIKYHADMQLPDHFTASENNLFSILKGMLEALKSKMAGIFLSELTEEYLVSLLASVKKNVNEVLFPFIEQYKEGYLNARHLTTPIRYLLQEIFSVERIGGEEEIVTPTLLTRDEAVLLDQALLNEYKQSQWSSLLKVRVAPELMLIPIPSDTLKPRSGPLTKNWLSGVLVYWYTFHQKKQEPTEVIDLVNIARGSTANLESPSVRKKLENFMSCYYQGLYQDRALCYLGESLCNDPMFAVSGKLDMRSVVQIQAFGDGYISEEMASYFDEGAQSYLESIKQSPPWKKGFFSLFCSPPKFICDLNRLLSQWQVARFGDKDLNDFTLNSLELDQLKTLITQHHPSVQLARSAFLAEKPDSISCLIILVGYILAKAMDKNPLYILLPQENALGDYHSTKDFSLRELYTRAQDEAKLNQEGINPQPVPQ